eukprot:PLAT6070.1.p1 GENE.PLAT6070.1~~PLAT6070.1.p1  ORF type:complete len:327 (-),score=119.04 PLAT6070.1:22-1002(-)
MDADDPPDDIQLLSPALQRDFQRIWALMPKRRGLPVLSNAGAAQFLRFCRRYDLLEAGSLPVLDREAVLRELLGALDRLNAQRAGKDSFVDGLLHLQRLTRFVAVGRRRYFEYVVRREEEKEEEGGEDGGSGDSEGRAEREARRKAALPSGMISGAVRFVDCPFGQHSVRVQHEALGELLDAPALALLEDYMVDTAWGDAVEEEVARSRAARPSPPPHYALPKEKVKRKAAPMQSTWLTLLAELGEEDGSDSDTHEAARLAIVGHGGLLAEDMLPRALQRGAASRRAREASAAGSGGGRGRGGGGGGGRRELARLQCEMEPFLPRQ